MYQDSKENPNIAVYKNGSRRDWTKRLWPSNQAPLMMDWFKPKVESIQKIFQKLKTETAVCQMQCGPTMNACHEYKAKCQRKVQYLLCE